MASAAVEMLTLSHCRKIMVFNTDLGLDSDTDTEGKRMLSEAEEDQEKGPVKKRRKQSKPVRIASSESLSDGENGICQSTRDDNVTIFNHNSNEVEYERKVNNGVKENFQKPCDQEETFNSNESSLLPINLSNAKFSSSYVATQAVDSNQNSKFEKTIRRSSLEVTGPSFQDPNFDGTHFERDSLFATSCSPLSLPTVKPLPSNGAVRHSGSPVRIFNPEAFCDLCNKEFCNKYFLKTHKANKHGIYTENVGPNLIDSLPSMPFINYFSNISEVLPSNSQIPRSVVRKPQLPVSLPQQNAVFLQKSVMANGNTRAFCNICQREFCNKYFVRRHKAKIHGIIDTSFPDTPPGELQELKPQNINDIKSCIGNHEKSEDHEIYSNFSDQQATVGSVNENDKQEGAIRQSRETDSEGCISPIQPLPDDTGKESDTGEKNKRISGITTSEAFCDICCKEYCNKYFLRTHKMRSHGITHPDWEKKDDRINVFENNLTPCTNQNTPLNLIIGDQALEKIDNDSSDFENGAIFCNICGQKFKDIFLLKMHTSYAHSQEFANKVREVVKTESDEVVNVDEKRFAIDLQTCSLLQCEICHKNVDAFSIENHIEAEHGNLLEEVGTLTEDNSNSQMFEKELKYDCALCHRQFVNPSLLNQHIIDRHGISGEQIPTDNIPNTKTVKEAEEACQKNNQSTGILNVTEVQATPTSSFCEICKKELCNKYFMKTHMQRMHGISIDNGAHIGGVVCDICNKELCSKYFLRVHKQNSHGIVDEILGLDMARNQSPSTDPSLRPSEQSDFNNRYFSHFTEVCTICSRRFRSMKWLKAHLLNDHGDEGKDKWKEFQTHYEFKPERFPQEIQKKSDATGNMMSIRNYNEGFSQKMDALANRPNGSEEKIKSNVFTTIFNGKNTNTKQYHCSYCPFSTSILAFLFVHERSHINSCDSFIEQNKKIQCKICSLTFESEDGYDKHCVSHRLSETTSSACNGFDKSNKSEPPIESESTMKGGCWEELKTDEITDVPRTELDFSEDSRKELLSQDRHRQDAELDVAMIRVKESLELIANKTDIPVSFSLPQNQKRVVMQPFVLEDSGQMGFKKSFLSSIVFLPVTERLTDPVTVSFKLTPTL